jgi:hypothetical protein
MRAPTAAPEPELDPPAVHVGFQGFRVAGGMPMPANSTVSVFPRIIAPAARSAAATPESGYRASQSIVLELATVGMPATWKTSLMPTGRPCNGPRNVPAAASRERASASRFAPAASTYAQARTSSSCPSMRARALSTRSTGSTSRLRTAPAISAAERSWSFRVTAVMTAAPGPAQCPHRRAVRFRRGYSGR